MDAFDVEKIQSFKRLGMKIECITAFKDKLLVVTEGQDLMQYQADSWFEPSKNKQVVKMSSFTHRVFEKQVSEMKAIPEIDVLLVVYDNTLHVHDIADEYKFKCSLTNTKGLTYFDVSVEEEVDVVKKIQIKVKVQVCVAIGKKLKILEWDGKAFKEELADLVLSNPAKGVLWCRNRIIVSFRNEYLIIKPQTGETKDVFAFGNVQKEPIMTRVSNNLALLQYDTKSLFVNSHGKRAKEDVITWTGIPSMLFHDAPYVVALMSKHVEVKSEDPSVSIQQMDIRNAKHICKGSDIVYIQTVHSIYTLTYRPSDDRIKHLVQTFHFDLAIQIQQQTDLPETERNVIIARIQSRKGIHLFCQRKFEESMNIFTNLQTDISHIVGMLPELLPSKLRNNLQYPERIPSFQGTDTDKAMRALADFLEGKRDTIERQIDLEPFTPIWQHKKNETLKTKDQALTVIDTTLLKCYLQINEAMVRRLLKKPGNRVHLTEAEKVLTKNEKFSELIVLYEQHKMEAKVLAVMKSQSVKKKSSLYGIEPTIQKLQQLGEANLPLIFEYAAWVFEEDLQEALTIFTEDLPEVRKLPRGHVTSYLSKIDLDIALDYLEHVIYLWEDNTEELHIDYAGRLREKVQELYLQYQQIHPGAKPPRAGDEEGSLGLYRHKFRKFLKMSTFYKAEDILTRLPLDCFFEERAILLGHMGRHEQALGIYVYILDNYMEAEEYCHDYYSQGDHEVYLHLLKIYLYPPGPITLGLQDYQEEPEPKIVEAISMLETHASLINLYKAVEMLPEHMLVKKLGTFLEGAMESHICRRLFNMVTKRVQYQDWLQASVEKVQQLSKKCVKIDDDTTCACCNLKIGNVVFVRYPSGHLAHYGCYRENRNFVNRLEEADDDDEW